MSLTLPKMSNITYSNGLCYYKIPLDYIETTDTHRYVFTVAADDFDYEFNSHAFDAGDYQPNCEVQNDPRGLYKKVAIISGAPDITYQNSYGVTITRPIAGFIKNLNADNATVFDQEYVDEEILSETKSIGFLDNRALIDNYSSLHNDVLESGLYHGGLTGYIPGSMTNESSYWTFISKVWVDGDSSKGFYVFGATTLKIIPSELNNQIYTEFSPGFDDQESLSINTVVLSSGNFAQMYQVVGNQYRIPSGLPTDYYRHTEKVSNAVVLWEQNVAFIPDPYSTSGAAKSCPKDSDYVIVCKFGTTTITQLDCYIQPSTSSTKLGSITGCSGAATDTSKVKVYRYYDVVETYDDEGKLHVWLRIGDPKAGNNCWIEYTKIGSTECTVTKAQTVFSFQLDNSADNFDAFTWKYAVVSNDHNTNFEKFNTLNRIGTQAANATGNNLSIWYDFVWNSEGNDILLTADEIEEGEGIYDNNLSALIWHRDGTTGAGRIPGSTTITQINTDRGSSTLPGNYIYPSLADPTNPPETASNPNTNVLNNNTYVSASDNAYRWLYILAESTSADGLLPYQVTYLDAEIPTDYVYIDNKAYLFARGKSPTASDASKASNIVVGNYYYLFRYKVPDIKDSSVTFVDSAGNETTIAKSSFSNLEIYPFIKDNKVQLYGKPIYENPTGQSFEPSQVGTITFKLITNPNAEPDQYDEIDMPGNRFSRGSKIHAYGVPKNGWNFDGFVNDEIFTLPTSDNYEVYVVSGNFSRKTDPITVKITNTDPSLGKIFTNFDDTAGGWVPDSTMPEYPNAVTKTIMCYESDLMNFRAVPTLLDDEGTDHNTGMLSRWEYNYNINQTTTEWRLLNNIQEYLFNVHLWQSEGSNVSKKSLYEYRAVWGQTCILY